MALTLPDHANVGDPGHVADTNLIIDALVDLDGRSGGGGGSTILDGTGPPSGGTGAAGQYYLDKTGRVLYGPRGSGSGFGAQQTSYASETVSVAANTAAAYGNDVLFAVAGRITGMRYYWAATSADSTKTLRVWSSAAGGTQLGNVSIPRGTAGSVGWAQTLFTTPLAITAGQTVRVVVEQTGTDPMARTNSIVADTVYGDVTRKMQGWTGLNNAYPTATTARHMFADVLFEPAVNLWPVALVSIPPGGTTGQVLKKTSAADYAVAWVT